MVHYAVMILPRQVQLMRARSVPGYEPEFRGLAETARAIMRANGLIGAYQGFSSTFIRNTLAGGSYFAVFDALRVLRARHHHCSIKHIPVYETFLCGG